VPLKQYIPKSKPAVSKKYPKHITRAMGALKMQEWKKQEWKNQE